MAFGFAMRNWQLANAAQKKAEAERNRAEEQTRLSFSRELAAAAINNIETDPELSVLLALRAASETYSINKKVTGEAEGAIRRALRALRVMRTLSATPMRSGRGLQSGWEVGGHDQRDKTAKVWEAASGQEVHTLSGHTDTVWGVAFSPDGRLVATASRDKTAKVWEAASGQEVHTLSGHTDMVSA